MPSIRFHVTEGLVASRIMREEYIRLANSTGTICILTLNNGFTVTGESFCVDPAHFDKDVGELIARKNAIDKLWTLEGYLAAEQNYLNKFAEDTFT